MRVRFAVLLFLGLLSAGSFAATVSVVCEPKTERTALAAEELCSYLERMYEDKFKTVSSMPKKGDVIILKAGNGAGEAYSVTTMYDGKRNVVTISAENERGIFCGVYGLLEKLGCGFYMSFEHVPATGGRLDFSELDFSDKPLVDTRAIFNWHNFLTSCSTWDDVDWQYFIRQSARMKYNSIMVHMYGNNPMIEFSHNGITKPVGWLSSSDRGRDWAVEHVQNVQNLIGGDLFKGRVFGAECANVPDDQRVLAVKEMMSRVFDYAANRYAMDVIFAYDMDTHPTTPQDIVMTLPESARIREKKSGQWTPRPDTPEGLEYYRSLVLTVMKDFPQITDFVVWSRCEPKLKWAFTFEREEMPEEWQKEYDRVEVACPGVEHAMISKAVHMHYVIRAVRQVLNEAGYENVKVGFGSWGSHHLFTAVNELSDGAVGFHILDAGARVSKHAEWQASMKKMSAKRSLNIVQWAHNDNIGACGRAANPPGKFGTSLAGKCGADGFGVIHWNWRPLDIYFKNLQQAVWENTKDERLYVSLENMSAALAGEQGDILKEYYLLLHRQQPWFGQESGPIFFRIKKNWNVPRVVKQSAERLALLEKIDLSKLTPQQREEVTFIKKHEKWIGRFFDISNQAASGDSNVWKTMKPEEGVRLFVDAVRHGDPDPGEKGLIVSLNLKWLTYLLEQKQALGLEPYRVNFQPTNHDPLAQNFSKYTFTFDENKNAWAGKGEAETGYTVRAVKGWAEKKGDKLLGGSWIEADEKLAVKIGDLHYKSTIPPSTGRVELLFPVVGEEVSFAVKLAGKDAGTITLKPGQGITRKTFDGIRVEGGALNVELSNSKGKTLLASVQYMADEIEMEESLTAGVVVEAEESTRMEGCTVLDKFSGYTGKGFVDMGGKGTWIEWPAEMWPEFGKPMGTMNVRYALHAGTRNCDLFVDGKPAGEVAFKSTGGWGNWGTVSVKVPALKKPATIRLVARAGGGPNLDQVSLSE